jgi:hypothetical protein
MAFTFSCQGRGFSAAVEVRQIMGKAKDNTASQMSLSVTCFTGLNDIRQERHVRFK